MSFETFLLVWLGIGLIVCVIGYILDPSLYDMGDEFESKTSGFILAFFMIIGPLMVPYLIYAFVSGKKEEREIERLRKIDEEKKDKKKKELKEITSAKILILESLYARLKDGNDLDYIFYKDVLSLTSFFMKIKKSDLKPGVRIQLIDLVKQARIRVTLSLKDSNESEVIVDSLSEALNKVHKKFGDKKGKK